MDRAAYLNALVSEPWDRDGLHCYEFVRRARRDLFGDAALPLFGPELTADKRGRMEAFASHPERARWCEVSEPVDGAVVLMTRRTSAYARGSHAGIYLVTDGRGEVWHCDAPHGVEAVSLDELRNLRRWDLTYLVRP